MIAKECNEQRKINDYLLPIVTKIFNEQFTIIHKKENHNLKKWLK